MKSPLQLQPRSSLDALRDKPRTECRKENMLLQEELLFSGRAMQLPSSLIKTKRHTRKNRHQQTLAVSLFHQRSLTKARPKAKATRCFAIVMLRTMRCCIMLRTNFAQGR